MTHIQPLNKEEERRISEQIGRNLRAIREYRGMSQKDLAALLGISFQQVQKYERGHNRLSLSKAVVLARHLGVSIQAFADGTDYTAGFTEDHLSRPQRNRIARITAVLPDLPVDILDTLVPLINALTRPKPGQEDDGEF